MIDEEPKYFYTFNKWLKAVVNIEVRESNHDRLTEALFSIEPRQISPEEISKIYFEMIEKSVPRTGTAFLVIENDEPYLISAKHLLLDSSASGEHPRIGEIFLIDSDFNIDNHNRKIDAAGKPVELSRPVYLKWLNAGTFIDTPFAFSSDDEDDVGVIALTGRSDVKDFYQTLLSRGYFPIDIKEMTHFEELKSGDKIFSIGFPEHALYATKKSPFKLWESADITAPVVSHGTYAGDYPGSDRYFEAFMHAYSGYSGAPVIKDSNLIGMVSAGEIREPFRTGTSAPYKFFFLNHSQYIKSKVILETLNNLKKKMANYEEQRRAHGLPPR
jgi:hypothetical protein